jgi:hypothetical protein
MILKLLRALLTGPASALSTRLSPPSTQMQLRHEPCKNRNAKPNIKTSASYIITCNEPLTFPPPVIRRRALIIPAHTLAPPSTNTQAQTTKSVASFWRLGAIRSGELRILQKSTSCDLFFFFWKHESVHKPMVHDPLFLIAAAHLPASFPRSSFSATLLRRTFALLLGELSRIWVCLRPGEAIQLAMALAAWTFPSCLIPITLDKATRASAAAHPAIVWLSDKFGSQDVVARNTYCV